MQWGVEISANGCRVQLPLRDADETTAGHIARAWMNTHWWCRRIAGCSVTATQISKEGVSWKNGWSECGYQMELRIVHFRVDSNTGTVIGPEMTLEDVVHASCWSLSFVRGGDQCIFVRVPLAPRPFPGWWPRDLAAKIVRGEADPDARLNWMWTGPEHIPKAKDLYLSQLDVALTFHPDVARWLRASPPLNDITIDEIEEMVCEKYGRGFDLGPVIREAIEVTKFVANALPDTRP